MDGSRFKQLFNEFTWLMDEPVTEAAAISLLSIARESRQDVTVVLSGEGSDEVFGGYPIYLFMQLVEHYKKVPATVRRGLLNPLLCLLGTRARKYVGLSNDAIEHTYMGVSFYDRDTALALLTEPTRNQVRQNPVATIVDKYFDATRDQPAQRRMQYVDVKTWLVDDLLIKADRMTMGASQELRVPFLDHRLLDFAARLPPEYRVKNGQTKYIMKKAMERHLPHKIIYRQKRGFPTPLGALFRDELRGLVHDTLESADFRHRGIFDPDRVSACVAEHMSGEADHHRILWQLMVLENWHRTFMDPAEFPVPVMKDAAIC
jgi:asparagine synthase (glutamine-hydrolysing)